MPRPRPDGTKKCPMCKEVKPVTDFYNSPKYDGGFSPYCKNCTAIKNKKNRSKHYEKHRAYMKKAYSDNPELFKAKSKEYLQYLKENRPALLRAKKFFDVKRKDVDPEITKEYLEQLFLNTKECQCCGRSLDLDYLPRDSRKYRSNPNAPSIDRVDNSFGYRKDNIAVICWECNYRKNDLSKADLLMFLKYIEECCHVV